MIHPTAIVDSSAELASDVTVGPWTRIGPGVTIGQGCEIASHVVIEGPTTIGSHCQIFQFASIGAPCQDRKYRNEPTTLEIGNDNIFREHVTVHRGTVQGLGTTRIGNGNLLMVGVHIAHDCDIGNNNIFANTTGVSGHVVVGDGVIFGGMTGIHQFCRIGSYAMTAGCSLVLKDIPAFVMVGGNPASAHGMNYEGMRRRGWSSETIRLLRRAYKTVYRQGLTIGEAIIELEESTGAETPELSLFIDSLKVSERGIIR